MDNQNTAIAAISKFTHDVAAGLNKNDNELIVKAAIELYEILVSKIVAIENKKKGV